MRPLSEGFAHHEPRAAIEREGPQTAVRVAAAAALGEADVVVVGGGGAGLAAALGAAEAGARVILLEKNPVLGGTTAISVGSFTAAGTSLQRQAGIADRPEDHVADMLSFAGADRHRANVSLHQVLARAAGPTLEWLRSLGVRFAGPFPEPPNRVPRMHNVVPTAGASIVTLQAQALRLGVTIHTGAPVHALLVGDHGRVTGVACRIGGRTGQLLARTGVVLAAGDYSSAPALKRRFADDEVATIEGINPTATGDGHVMGLTVGADVVNMELMLGPQIRFVPPPTPGPGLPTTPSTRPLPATVMAPEPALFAAGAILINRRGARFVDETGTRRAHDVAKQPAQEAFVVFDRRIARRFSAWPDFVSTAPDIAYAYVPDYRARRPDLYHEGATPDALARAIGADPDALAGAVDVRNAAAAGERPDPWGRRSLDDGLRLPPYYALGPARAWIVHTDGGLRVDASCRVLRPDGTRIDGLFAAGSTGQGGLVIWGHGLHLAWAFSSGRMAGQSAAGSPAAPLPVP